jgi:hypothetical protein
MLRRNAFRIRHHRHRLHAASALCRQQTCAIIPKRLLSIGIPEHLRQFIDVRRKAIRMFEFVCRDPFRPPADRNLDNHLILKQDHLRRTDSEYNSVVLNERRRGGEHN